MTEDTRQQANVAFRHGDWLGAISGYTKAIKELHESGQPDDKKLFSNRSAAYYKLARELREDPDAQHEAIMKNLEYAVQDGSAAAEIDPTWSKAWCRMGAPLLEAERYLDAKEVLEKGAAFCPDSEDIEVLLERALELFAEFESMSVKAQARGAEFLADGDFRSAVTAFTAAVSASDAEDRFPAKELYAGRCEAYMGWAETLGGEEAVENAIDDADRCIRIAPTWGIAWSCKARALCLANRLADARKELRKGLELCPDDVKLQELLREVDKAVENEDSNSRRKRNDARNQLKPRDGVVKDTELYEVLGVKPDATPSSIKKAYYLQAKKCHPDRHPDDPEATQKFQRLGEAYQVLSNEHTRAMYDANGVEGLQENNFETMDSSQLFDMLFGSDQFEFLVGELSLASLASNVDEDGNSPSEEIMRGIQRTRVRKLVDELLRILRPWIEGDKTAFAQWACTKAACMVEANSGPAMLYTIGQVYVRKADIFLGRNHLFGLPSVLSSLGYSSQKLSTKVRASGAAMKVMDKQRKMQERVSRLESEGRSIDEEEAQRMAMDMVENAFDMMWKITVVDIQTTLDEVANIILEGKDLPVVDADLQFLDLDDETMPFGMMSRTSSGLPYPRLSESSSKRDTNSSHSSKFTLEGIEKGIGRFLLPKKEHSEGRRVRKREDILHARATGLRKLGKIFMKVGHEAATSTSNVGVGSRAGALNGGSDRGSNCSASDRARSEKSSPRKSFGDSDNDD